MRPPPAGANTIGVVDTSLKGTLHKRGLRMTPQRQLVLDAVHDLGHATPEQVCSRVQETAPAVNITTVYRTLDLLEELGVVRHAHLGHGAPTYSEHQHRHVHLVCHHCGRVDEAPTELLSDVAERTLADLGFHLDATHVALSGTCVDCADHTNHTDDTSPTGAVEGDR
ncbi:Transcriptional regulator, FUR family [Pseudonocardia sp. Ae263_Ps1]|nr:Transcriptional regulator, FUR family [Pseudonocardia sp. Ae263_Ps1]OLL95410.1 Transcriptional regulator, FUR family [Pseudonocardia sp. Ae356_Ps1]